MLLELVSPELSLFDAPPATTLACGIFADERPFRGVLGLVDWRMAGRLSALARSGFVDGSPGEMTCIVGHPHVALDGILLVGLGPRAAFGEDGARRGIVRLLDALAEMKRPNAFVELPGRGSEVIEAERALELLVDSVTERTPPLWLLERPNLAPSLSQFLEQRRRASLLSAL